MSTARELSVELALEQAQPGMVLAAPLLDAHGATLLPAGAALTEATLAGLGRRGVERCVVVQEAGDAGGAPSAADLAERARQRELRQARLLQLFRHQSGNEGGAALLRLLADYRNRD
jgi:hypothetical protein